MKYLNRLKQIPALLVLICWFNSTSTALPAHEPVSLRVLTFNVLQGGREAANVGFPNRDFGGSRFDELAEVIRLSGAHVVGIQEDDRTGELFKVLGEGWRRVGSIYSRFPVEAIRVEASLCAARVTLPEGSSVVIVNCHWRPHDYGPFLVQEFLTRHGAPRDMREFEQYILNSSDRTDGDRGSQQTLDALTPFVESGVPVVLTGDFNEPSHLDWTERAADVGMDRWVANSTGIALRFPIRWRGSTGLASVGLQDAYRTHFPDEVKHPGNTWTPSYPDKTPGRRPFGDQVLDRIDRIYFAGPGVSVIDAAVVGESTDFAEVAFESRWPSDHRAVVAEFELRDE